LYSLFDFNGAAAPPLFLNPSTGEPIQGGGGGGSSQG